MKSIFTTTFFLLLSFTALAQIKISGVSNVSTVSGTQVYSKTDTNFVRKQIDVTNTTVQKSPSTNNYVIKNDYNSSTVDNNDGKVSISLDPLNSSNSANQQVIIDMNKAKEVSLDTPKVQVQTQAPSNTTNTSAPTFNSPTGGTGIKIGGAKPTTTTTIEPEKTTTNVSVPATTTTTTPTTTTNVAVPNVTTTTTMPVVPTESPKTNTTGIKINTPNTTSQTNVNTTTPNTQTSVNTQTQNSLTTQSSGVKTTNNSTTSTTEYPKKNANYWALGFNLGVPFVTGDVHSKLGHGASLTVQRALGHVVSLRYQSFFGQTFGQDWKLKGAETAYKNYKSRVSDHSLQAVFSLNNINFYKRQPKVIFNVIAGVGFATRMSWINNLDENGNAYDYSGIPVPVDKGSKKEILSALNETVDKGGYETKVPNDKLSGHIKDTDINPAVMFGIGLGYRLSKRLDINLEHRVSWQNTDNLDAFTYGNNNDLLHYTSLGLNIKLGKKEDAMWWMNPVFAAYDDINALKKKVDEGDLLKDEDKDGVADIFDKDLNTPENVPVTTHGVASDLDKDGIPDYQDKEPFTPLGAKVDKDGKAIDTDNDGVIDLYDKDNNTPQGVVVNQFGQTVNNNNSNYASGQGSTITGTSNPTIPTNKNEISVVLFNNNSSTIPKDYYSELYKVLSVLKSNPNAKFLITGHADVKGTENYNLNLSKQRAESVYKMLTEVFKVPSNNLELNYVGETNPFVQGLPESYSAQYEPGHHLNRRVEITLK